MLEMPAVRVQLVRHLPGRPTHPEPVPADADRPDIFLSYYHEDGEFVRRLAASVAERGYVPWYDRIGLTGGATFPNVIERALEATRYVGLVATEKALSRRWVQLEKAATLVREGEENRTILVPLRIDDSELSLFLKTKNWCDFTGTFDVGVGQLLEVLND